MFSIWLYSVNVLKIKLKTIDTIIKNITGFHTGTGLGLPGVFLLEQFTKQNVWPMFFFPRCDSTYFRFQERIPQGNRGKSCLPRLSFFWFSCA